MGASSLDWIVGWSCWSGYLVNAQVFPVIEHMLLGTHLVIKVSSREIFLIVRVHFWQGCLIKGQASVDPLMERQLIPESP